MKGFRIIFFWTFVFLLHSGDGVSQNIQRYLKLEKAIPAYRHRNKRGKEKKKKLEVADHKYYKLGYWDEHKQSVWVAYLLTKEMVEEKNAKRTNRFRIDNTLSNKSASSSDYTHSGYDRGHLCPSADMRFSQKAQDMTFLMSNISPQLHSFNAGKWKKLEEKVRQWAIENDSIIVITGPILDSIIGRIGKNNVSIPYSFYKIIIDVSYPDYKAIAFIMPNQKLDRNLEYYSMSIRDLEKKTGLNFFPRLWWNSSISKLETEYSDWGLSPPNNKSKTIKNKKSNVEKTKDK